MADQSFIADQIANGVYTLSQRRKGKSHIWNVFAEILKEDETVVEGVVCCQVCGNLLKYVNHQPSSNLNRHKCCQEHKQPQKLEPVKANDKKQAIDLCTGWAVEDCRPFSAINGSGFVKLANFFIRMGALYGQYVDVPDLLPDPAEISHHLQKSADEIRNQFKKEIIEVVNSGGASATINMWSDSYAGRNFLGVILHFQRNSKLFDIVLGMKSMDFERSSNENILRKLMILFSEFGVQNIEAIKFVTDSKSNIVEALQHNTRLNCSSHLLSNVLEKSFEETSELTTLLKASKDIFKYFKKTHIERRPPTSLKNQYPIWWNFNYTMLKFIVDNWSNIHDVVTKNYECHRLLNINIFTLKALVEFCNDFDVIFKKLQLCSSPSLCFVLPSIHKIKNLCLPNSADILAISVLKLKIVKQIDDIWVKNLSIWHKAAFFLYPPAASLKRNDLNEIKKFCITSIYNLENDLTASTSQPAKHSQIQLPEKILLSSPTYRTTSPIELPEKTLMGSPNCRSSSPIQLPEKVILGSPTCHTSSPMDESPITPSGSLDNLSSCSVSNPISPSASDNKHDIQFFFSDLLGESGPSKSETPDQEVDRYSREKVKITEDFKVIEWWKNNAKSYPLLSKIALQIHSIPASSTAAEQVFSKAGNIIIQKMNSQGPRAVNDLLFLHSCHKMFNE